MHVRVLPLLVMSPQFVAPVPEGPPDLRIATYNVNYGLAGDPAGLDAIAATRADVIVIEEASAEWVEALQARFPDHYQATVQHASPAGGLAILSRVPFETTAVVDSPVGWFPAWTVVVHHPAGDLQVVALHLQPPYAEVGGFVLGPFTTSDEREIELLAALATLDPELPTVVLGDLNERRGRAVRALEDRGFVSATHELGIDVPTWRWDLPVGRLRGRLDHVFVGPGLDIVAAEVLDAGRSDHLPVVAEVAFR